MKTLEPVYKAIAPSRCRTVCQFMSNVDETPVTLDEVVTHIVTEEQAESDNSVADNECRHQVALELHHEYLPKLERAFIIHYDIDMKLADSGPRFPAAMHLTQAGQEIKDQTPFNLNISEDNRRKGG